MDKADFEGYWVVARPAQLAYVAKHWSRLSPEDREDVVQTAALKAYRLCGRVELRDKEDPGAAFMGWAFRVTRSCVLDHLRTQFRKKDPGRFTTAFDPLLHDGVEAVDFDEESTKELSAQALLLLPPAYRGVIAGWLEGLKQTEISDQRGYAAGTVCSSTSKARAKLRELTGYPAEGWEERLGELAGRVA